MIDTKYGLGNNPPYSLYQGDNGKWGLIDGSGNKLEAAFTRAEKDCFSSSPWEIVTFSPQEGFELLAWYDPSEVWFNFTFDNPHYPTEYARLLWKESKNDIEGYRDVLYELIPNENHLLIDEILLGKELRKMNDDDFCDAIEALLSRYPQILKPSITNPMLDPVMRNPDINEDVKIALWRAKVRLDSYILTYLDDFMEEV